MSQSPLRFFVLATALGLSVAAAEEAADVLETDPVTGLVIAGGWTQVRSNCTACHSARLITQQRGDEAFWTYTIRWMQAEQNLWELAEDVERAIVEYLAKHYPPRVLNPRRLPLTPELSPGPAGKHNPDATHPKGGASTERLPAG